jgi:hypothetical protein
MRRVGVEREIGNPGADVRDRTRVATDEPHVHEPRVVVAGLVHRVDDARFADDAVVAEQLDDVAGLRLEDEAVRGLDVVDLTHRRL